MTHILTSQLIHAVLNKEIEESKRLAFCSLNLRSEVSKINCIYYQNNPALTPCEPPLGIPLVYHWVYNISLHRHVIRLNLLRLELIPNEWFC